MDNKKIGLDKLKVQSFVTSISGNERQTIKGGSGDPHDCSALHACHTQQLDPHNGCGLPTNYGTSCN